MYLLTLMLIGGWSALFSLAGSTDSKQCKGHNLWPKICLETESLFRTDLNLAVYFADAKQKTPSVDSVENQ